MERANRVEQRSMITLALLALLTPLEFPIISPLPSKQAHQKSGTINSFSKKQALQERLPQRPHFQPLFVAWSLTLFASFLKPAAFSTSEIIAQMSLSVDPRAFPHA